MRISDEQEVYLRARLKDELLRKFKRMKKHYGVEADTELIRILINQEYRRLFELNM